MTVFTFAQTQRIKISIRIPRVGDDRTSKTVFVHICISIRIPRVGDDITHSGVLSHDLYFNPHPPCGG